MNIFPLGILMAKNLMKTGQGITNLMGWSHGEVGENFVNKF